MEGGREGGRGEEEGVEGSRGGGERWLERLLLHVRSHEIC